MATFQTSPTVVSQARGATVTTGSLNTQCARSGYVRVIDNGTYTNHYVKGIYNNLATDDPAYFRWGYQFIEKTTGAVTPVQLGTTDERRNTGVELPDGYFGGQRDLYQGSVWHSNGPVLTNPVHTTIPDYNASTDTEHRFYAVDSTLFVCVFTRTFTLMGKTNYDLRHSYWNGSSWTTSVVISETSYAQPYTASFRSMHQVTSSLMMLIYRLTYNTTLQSYWAIFVNITNGSVTGSTELTGSSGIYAHTWLTPYGDFFQDATYTYCLTAFGDGVDTPPHANDHAATLGWWRWNTATPTAPTLVTSFGLPTLPTGYADTGYVGHTITYDASSGTAQLVSLCSVFDGTKSGGTIDGYWRLGFNHRQLLPTRDSSWSSYYLITGASFYTNSTEYYTSWGSDASIVLGNTPGPDQQCGVIGPGITGSGYPTHSFQFFWRQVNYAGYYRRWHVVLDFWTPPPPQYNDGSLTAEVTDSTSITGWLDTLGYVSAVIESSAYLNSSVATQADFPVKYQVESSVSYQEGELIVTIEDATSLTAVVQTMVDGEVIAVWTDDTLLAADVGLYHDAELVAEILDAIAIDGSIQTEVIKDLNFGYMFLGTEWHQEFVDIVNTYRAGYGLPPYKLMTRAMYQAFPDSAQLQTDNMVALRWFAHEGAPLPADYDTFAEKQAYAQADAALENIQVGFPDQYFDPTTYAYVQSSPFPIITDQTIATPLEAFLAWWNSTGHRAAMMYDFNSDDIYSTLGIGVGLAPTNVGWGEPWLSSNAFYYTNTFLRYGPEQVGMKNRYFNVSADFNGALIEYLNLSYDSYAYMEVLSSHSTKYSLRVGVQNEAPYGGRVAQQHVAPIHYGVQQAHTSQYGPTVGLIADSLMKWDLLVGDPVVKDHTAIWNSRIAGAHTALYSTPPRVQVQLIAPYGVMARFGKQHSAPYSGTVTLKKAHTSKYSLLGTIAKAHIAPYVSTSNTRQDSDAVYSILNVETVREDSKAFYSLLSGTTSYISPSAYVTLNGVNYDIEDAVVSQDEDGYAWGATIKFSDISNFLQFEEGDTITLSFGGESYSLVVTSKSISRNAPANVEMTLEASSPTIAFDTPNAEPQTYTFEVVTSAKDAVESILGQAVTWQLVNWQIPANRIQFENVTPLEAVKKIVFAAGGIIQTQKNGSILIRSLFPIPTNFYVEASPAHVFTDDEDNLSISESYVYKEGYNEFRIREGEAAFGDVLDYEQDEEDPTHGTLHFYPSPWRSEFLVRLTDSDGATLVTELGVVVKEFTEIVQFVDGVANPRYPVKLLKTTTWLSDQLGSVSYETYGKSLSTDVTVNSGYGLAEVVYDYESYDYDITGVLGTSVQFIVEDL